MPRRWTGQDPCRPYPGCALRKVARKAETPLRARRRDAGPVIIDVEHQEFFVARAFQADLAAMPQGVVEQIRRGTLEGVGRTVATGSPA